MKLTKVKNTLLTVILSLLVSSLSAQITGKIQDATDNYPLEYATAALYNKNDKSLATDITMRGVSFVDIPLQQPIGRYQYRLWIKKPGQEEEELDKSHSVTGQEAFLNIWDEKLTDSLVSGEVLWKKTYGKLLPKKLGPVISGFSEY